ncbi:uncharacterized protein [Ambystoma mexicanum]|uniref:uncharacterized protein n=1 Tax=Ambystoma mexicanum TaxID=8296 RepID=UPI0037E88715
MVCLFVKPLYTSEVPQCATGREANLDVVLKSHFCFVYVLYRSIMSSLGSLSLFDSGEGTSDSGRSQESMEAAQLMALFHERVLGMGTGWAKRLLGHSEEEQPQDTPPATAVTPLVHEPVVATPAKKRRTPRQTKLGEVPEGPSKGAAAGVMDPTLWELGERSLTLGVLSRYQRGYTGRKVWANGHSFITRAEKRARARPRRGIHFGFQETERVWLGTPGMQWRALLPALCSQLSRMGAPRMLIVHLGGNDLADLDRGGLLKEMQEDIRFVGRMLPETEIAWSEIFPRGVWRGEGLNAAMEKSRRQVNKNMERFMKQEGLAFTRHLMLCDRDTANFAKDGVHLPDAGMDTFNLVLRRVMSKEGCT